MDGAGLARLLAGMVNRQVKNKPTFNFSILHQDDATLDGLTNYFTDLIDILMDEEREEKAGIKPKVREVMVRDLARIAGWKNNQQLVKKFNAEQMYVFFILTCRNKRDG
jgi:hypothetical protein